jgi:uncharacterized protein (DUF169 family)
MERQSSYAHLSGQLVDKLRLELPPVALTYLTAQPDGIPEYTGERPSACSFWRVGEKQVVWVPAEKHSNCSVGAYTQGFQLTEAVGKDLQDTMRKMSEVGYLGADEPPGIPTVTSSPKGIVYGPLRDFPLTPDVVVMWLNPRQGMLYDEAAGQVRWTTGDKMPVYGRPSCAALPNALNKSTPTLSMGCVGMRIYTDIPDDRMLVALPGRELAGFVERLNAAAAANAAMVPIYEANKARFAGAG